MNRVVKFIASNSKPHSSKVALLPPGIRFDPEAVVFLNIPMDAETPSGRLLRPQAVVLEELLRQYVSTFCYRMDLKKARSTNLEERAEEESRFRTSIASLNSSRRLRLMITDSQAMDVVHKWTTDANGVDEVVPLTTFSVTMINYLSGGRLPKFVDGIKQFENLKRGDRVLICEACNHDRHEACEPRVSWATNTLLNGINRIQDDIGTVQIPTKLKRRFGEGVVGIDHAFGREYQTKILGDYQLVIHCGGCMLDQQKMNARLSDIESSGVPITNYGLLLSYLSSKQALDRVLRPWTL